MRIQMFWSLKMWHCAVLACCCHFRSTATTYKASSRSFDVVNSYVNPRCNGCPLCTRTEGAQQQWCQQQSPKMFSCVMSCVATSGSDLQSRFVCPNCATLIIPQINEFYISLFGIEENDSLLETCLLYTLLLASSWSRSSQHWLTSAFSHLALSSITICSILFRSSIVAWVWWAVLSALYQPTQAHFTYGASARPFA